MADHECKETATDRKVKLAEISKLEQEADHQKALAYLKRGEAELTDIVLQLKRREQLESMCSNKLHHEFYFNQPVDAESVYYCINMLALWARMDEIEARENPAHTPQDIKIVFNSPGGSIISGLELYDHIQLVRRRGHKVTTGTVGVAASMASVLVQSGDVRWMSHEAWMLIHQGSLTIDGVDLGKAKDTFKWLEKIHERVLNIFATRACEATGKTFGECRTFLADNWERTDFWNDSDACKENGYVDEVR